MFNQLTFDTKFGGSFLAPFYVNGRKIDDRKLLSPEPIPSTDILSVGCEKNLRLHDLNFGVCDLLLCRSRAAQVVLDICATDLQIVPVKLMEYGNDGLNLMHVLTRLDCIDTKKSQYTRWTVNDHRGDLAGRFRMMMKLVIDPEVAQGHHLFRLVGWEFPLIASQVLVDALTREALSGYRAVPVSE